MRGVTNFRVALHAYVRNILVMRLQTVSPEVQHESRADKIARLDRARERAEMEAAFPKKRRKRKAVPR